MKNESRKTNWSEPIFIVVSTTLLVIFFRIYLGFGRTFTIIGGAFGAAFSAMIYHLFAYAIRKTTRPSEK